MATTPYQGAAEQADERTNGDGLVGVRMHGFIGLVGTGHDFFPGIGVKLADTFLGGGATGTQGLDGLGCRFANFIADHLFCFGDELMQMLEQLGRGLGR